MSEDPQDTPSGRSIALRLAAGAVALAAGVAALVIAVVLVHGTLA